MQHEHKDERVDERHEHGLVVVTTRCELCGRLAKHIEDEVPPLFDVVAFDADASATELRFGSPERHAVGDLVLNAETGELVRLDDRTDDGFTVTRAIGDARRRGQAMRMGEEVMRVGNVNDEPPAPESP